MRNHLISTIFTAIALVSVHAFADDSDFQGDVILSFSSQGPDSYVDGTIVPDGECYALVWSPAGKTFSGFNADGTAASALDRVVLAGPLALNGKCRDSLFQIPADTYQALEGGEWAVCLVDTRWMNGVPAGVKDGKPVRVNRWGVVNGGVTVKPASALTLAASVAGGTRSRASVSASTSSGARASKLSKVPESAPKPTITTMDVADGIVTLSVADTVPWLSYTIESGRRLGDFAIDGYADKLDGDDTSEIVLETDAVGTTRFFRIIRAE